MTAVHVVLPDAVDDPARPSGGNTYDRRVCRGLTSLGWSVLEHAVPGSWPWPDATARAALDGVLAAVPDDAVVLLDGLVASTVPEVMVPAARRLRPVVLVHMPLGHEVPGASLPDRRREFEVLSAAAAVVATSRWTQRWLVESYALPAEVVHVAEPGVDAADLAPGTTSGGNLLCVGAVAPHKGHDVLLAALALVRDLDWRCVCVGSLDLDPGFVASLRQQARGGGIADRIRFPGPQTGLGLDVVYAQADLLVLGSWVEAYGMVVTEALAHGLPVVATSVGGVPEALGSGAEAGPPGILVPPGDSTALAAALRSWLDDAELRERLRRAAGDRRTSLPTWSTTTARISRVLARVAA